MKEKWRAVSYLIPANVMLFIENTIQMGSHHFLTPFLFVACSTIAMARRRTQHLHSLCDIVFIQDLLDVLIRQLLPSFRWHPPSNLT